ncbi:MAG: hypothetical protein ACLFVX_11205 [Archaeoglobaceae archaeon]
MHSDFSHMPSQHKDWLPSDGGLLKPHSYCVKCGIVKNVSLDRESDLGYFAPGKKVFYLIEPNFSFISLKLSNSGWGDVYGGSISSNSYPQ